MALPSAINPDTSATEAVDSAADIAEATTAEPTARSTTDSAVAWRRLTPRLWVGRREDEFVGSIERGRHYRALDPEGQLVGVFHDFATAEAVLDGSLPAPEADTRADTHAELPPVAWAAAGAGAFALLLGALALLIV